MAENRRLRIATIIAGVLLLESISVLADAPVDFSRQIRPILSEHCFACHGFDPAARQADLQLDQRDTAIAMRDGQAAVAPGNPSASAVWQRISSTDPDMVMPPPSTKQALTDAQQQLIKRWIEQGAQYEQHWAFRPIIRPEVPAHSVLPDSTSTVQSVHPIDAFVRRDLESRGLKPTVRAQPAVLLRRLYLDLLGLQPNLSEADAFIADPSPAAYAQLVDRILENPHYGERWGRHWLDQARYADSNGYTIDAPRVMWPYRDWVIDAVNRDLPFDQFTIEQLAGDLLPAATKQQHIATGFHRNTLINQEGGVKADQYRNEALVDRVNTTGAVWLGLTIGCAQCHTHKYDPISHRDFYRFYAFFNGCDDSNNEATTVPVLEDEIFGWTPAQLAKLDQLNELRARIADLDRQLAAAKSANLVSFDWQWQPAELLDYGTLGMGAFLKQPDGSLLSDLKARPNDAYQVTVRTPGEQITAIRLRVLPHESLPVGGPGLAGNGNFVLTSFEVRVGSIPMRLAAAAADHAQPDYPVLDAIDDKPTTGWAINVEDDQRKANPQLKMNAPHEAVFVFSTPIANKVETILTLRHELNQGYLIGRFAIDLSEVAPPVNESAALQASLADVKSQVEQLEAQLPGGGRPVNQMVMRDTEKPQDTFLLKRGDFLTPDRELGPLDPSVPAALVAGVAPGFRSRLDLARWLVSRDNPLTSRVTVNRVWMRYFGRGLVETENDFGAQGTPPSHPELLDWLAAEFMEQGWSLKRLHHLIVTSETYQQSSDDRPDCARIDPRNVLLARQTRMRVDAEIVRDLVLSASGGLTSRIGGPSVHPPQPAGVYSFTQNSKNWPETQGPDRYRRTLYTMFYRSAPYPLLTTFDAPEFSTVCTRRARSNTPLQALAVANDPMFVELAQLLAMRVLEETANATDAASRLRKLFRLCLIREPSERELQLLNDFWRRERDRYAQDAEAAGKIAPAASADAIPASEAAAWTALSRVLFNTDEFLTRN